jgi:hypothetical protein
MTKAALLREIAAADAQYKAIVERCADFHKLGAELLAELQAARVQLARLSELLELHNADGADDWQTGSADGDAL